MLRAFARETVLYGIIIGLGHGLTLILVPVYTRFFNPSEYGVVDLITSIVVFFTIAGMVQMESSSGRYYYEAGEAERHRIISTAFWTVAGISVVLVLPVVLLADQLSFILFSSEKYSDVLVVACGVVGVGNVFRYLMGMVRFIRKLALYAVAHFLHFVVTLTLSIVFVVYLDWGIAGVFYAQMIGLTIALVVAVGAYIKMGLLRCFWSLEVVKRLMGYSLPLVPGVLGAWGNSYANRFVMLGMLSVGDIGVYGVAVKVASVFKLIEEAIKMTWSPYVFERLDRLDHQKELRQVLHRTALVVFFLVVMACLYAKEIMSILVPEAYDSAVPVAILLMWVFGVMIHYQLVVVGPGISKKTVYSSIIVLCSVALNLILVVYMIPLYGLMGVPIASACAVSFTLGLGWVVSERLYPVGYSIVRFAIPSVCALGIVVMLLLWDPGFEYRFSMSLVLSCVGLLLFLGKRLRWSVSNG